MSSIVRKIAITLKTPPVRVNERYRLITSTIHYNPLDMVTPPRLTLLVAVLGFSSTLFGQNAVVSDECAMTAGMQVYSNVFVHKETGDLLGYDLAIKIVEAPSPQPTSATRPPLFNLFSTPSSDGIQALMRFAA